MARVVTTTDPAAITATAHTAAGTAAVPIEKRALRSCVPGVFCQRDVASAFHQLVLPGLGGEELPLAQFGDRITLVVNVASSAD